MLPEPLQDLVLPGTPTILFTWRPWKNLTSSMELQGSSTERYTTVILRWIRLDSLEKETPDLGLGCFIQKPSSKARPVYFHTSTVYTDPADGERKTTTKQPGFIVPGSDGFPGAGHARHGYAGGNNPTGLLRRKHINPNTPDGQRSSTDWIIMRLGEVMLNYVEAAFYLGDPNGDMAMILNDEIRERAGMPALTAEEITEDKIRQERQVELSFEEHVFWDLRRWRIAVEELDNKARHKTTWIKDFDTGMYFCQMEHGDKGRVRLHPERNYYYALGLGRIADNPNLVENPGY